MKWARCRAGRSQLRVPLAPEGFLLCHRWPGEVAKREIHGFALRSQAEAVHDHPEIVDHCLDGRTYPAHRPSLHVGCSSRLAACSYLGRCRTQFPESQGWELLASRQDSRRDIPTRGLHTKHLPRGQPARPPRVRPRKMNAVSRSRTIVSDASSVDHDRWNNGWNISSGGIHASDSSLSSCFGLRASSV